MIHEAVVPGEHIRDVAIEALRQGCEKMLFNGRIYEVKISFEKTGDFVENEEAEQEAIEEAEKKAD